MPVPMFALVPTTAATDPASEKGELAVTGGSLSSAACPR
jgi:hypothetical protein